MIHYDTDSDDSIENMKLDIIKAKYAHEKLNKPTNISCRTNNNEKLRFQQQRIHNEKSQFLPTKGNSLPTASKNSSVNMMVNESKSSQSCDSKLDDDVNDLEDMNNYIDLLLQKKHILLNDCSENQSNLLMNLPKSDASPSRVGIPSINSHVCASNSTSTDILAQWRLRRKMYEASIDSKTGNQHHYDHMDLFQNERRNLSSASLKGVDYVKYGELSCNKIERTDNNDDDCDRIPVRDSASREHYTWMHPNVTQRQHLPIVKFCDFSCQCNFGMDNVKIVSKDATTNTVESMRKMRSTKLNKSMATMTNVTCSNNRGVETINNSTQTDKFVDVTESRQHLVIATNSNDYLCGGDSSPDFIDAAIKRTLNQQLFERNNSPVPSTVTSLNENVSVNSNICSVPLKNPDKYLADHESNFITELPWNENFEILSDGEFDNDDILRDLRRRRTDNLNKMKQLSKKIEAFNRKQYLPNDVKSQYSQHKHMLCK